jgi:hypothetical protein
MHGSVKQRYSHFWTWKDWSAIPSASPYLESMAPGGPGTGSGLRWRPPGLRFMMANIAATSATIIHPQHPRVAGLVGWLAGWIGSCLRAASACGPGFLEKIFFYSAAAVADLIKNRWVDGRGRVTPRSWVAVSGTHMG